MFDLKYRPRSFKEFQGNETAIKNLVAKFPNWPTTFLLAGEPGIGKTTLARLIAKQLNCQNIREIDAGQDRGIDNIRRIIKELYHQPLVGENKISIFDECQGLTVDAQQALLKITEEAPKNTYFVFCSTDPKKILKALKERCYTIVLNALTNKEIALIIKRICEEEEIKIDDRIKSIAKICVAESNGVPRKAVKMFDRFHTYENPETVKSEIGYFEEDETIWQFVNALQKGDTGEYFRLLQNVKRGYYESHRITMGHIFKKKVMNGESPRWLNIFSYPVDSHNGDIEIVNRITNEIR